MSNIYQYVDYKTLIDDLINGNYIVNQPIKNDTEILSFLGNLLNYSNISKSNLHKILVSILDKLKQKIFHTHLKCNGKKLLDHVSDEWLKDNNNNEIFCDHDCSSINNLGNHIQNKNNYIEFLNNLENRFANQKFYSKILPEQDLEEYSVIELRNSIDDINKKCKLIIDSLDKDLNLIEAEKYKIDNIDLSLLLDMSMKHTNLYKMINENNEIDISENIHNIYMNYTLVLNLLKKQINHIRQIILDTKEDILKYCNNINELLNNIKTSKVKNNRVDSFF